jgi:hypothetical protein
MIDTEKYEGHTPAPWDVREAGINRIMVFTDDEDFAYEEANRNLVADAPLLLAEVKRLHKQLVAYTDFVLWVEEYHNEVFDEYEGKDEL